MKDSTLSVSRRTLLAGVLGGLTVGRPSRMIAREAGHAHIHGQDGSGGVAAQDVADSSVARLSKPWLAGQPRARIKDADNDPFIIEIEKQIKCNCGCAHSLYGCRTTDFVCGFWQPLHAQVVGMADRGMSAEEIIDAYVTEHGTQFLMAPAPRGFNLAGYLVPGALISLVAATLVLVLRRRVQVAGAELAPVSTTALSEADQARLKAELEKLES